MKRLLRWLVRRHLCREFNSMKNATELYELIREEFPHWDDNPFIKDQDLTVAFNRTLRTGEVRFRSF